MLNQQWFRRVPDLEEGATFLRKWGLVGVLIGAGTGLGALCLIWLIEFFSRYLLGDIVAYTPPLPGGEGGQTGYVFRIGRLWLLPIVTTGAGLIGGFLTWKLAPETAGIGTNAAIRAFHANAPIKPKTSVLKLLISALTIGGGLTSGREGPIAQIGAATGASIADA